MAEKHPWAKALSIDEKTLAQWQKLAGDQPLLEWCFQNRKFLDSDYLAWATEHYLMPSLSAEYFTTEFDPKFFKKVQYLSEWNQYCFPVGAWDGVLFVACAVPTENLDVFCPYRLVLAPPHVMAHFWRELNGEKEAPTPAPAAQAAAEVSLPAAKSSRQEPEDWSDRSHEKELELELAPTITQMPMPPAPAKNAAKAVQPIAEPIPPPPTPQLAAVDEEPILDLSTAEEELENQGTPEEDGMGGLELNPLDMDSALDSIDFGAVQTSAEPKTKPKPPAPKTPQSTPTLLDLTPDTVDTLDLEIDTSAETVPYEHASQKAHDIPDEGDELNFEFEDATPATTGKSDKALPSLNISLPPEETDNSLDLQFEEAGPSAKNPKAPPPPPSITQELQSLAGDDLEFEDGAAKSPPGKAPAAQLAAPATNTDHDKTQIVADNSDAEAAALAMLQDVLGQKATMKGGEAESTHQYDNELGDLLLEMASENELDENEVEKVDMSQVQYSEDTLSVNHTITSLDELSLIHDENTNTTLGGDDFNFDFAATAVLHEPRVSEFDRASDRDEVGKIALDIMGKYFKQNMILLFQQGHLKAWKWDANWAPKPPASEQAVDLKLPSIFRIAHRTNLPYHGYIVPNDTNNRFFNTWNRYQLPHHITIMPLTRGTNQIGMLVGATSDEIDKELTLEVMQELADKMSANLVRVSGASASPSAAS